MTPVNNVKKAIEQIKKGKMLIITDRGDRENEGDFFIPAEIATHSHILTMIRRGGGLLCVAITKKQAHKLKLTRVKFRGREKSITANITVSVNASSGITTGVSAFDRAHTARILASEQSSHQDIVTPGHIIGLVARDGGVLERDGHTEAAVDLAKMAGFSPAGVLCEIVGNNGRMAKSNELKKIAKELKIQIVSVNNIIAYKKLSVQGAPSHAQEV